MTSIIPSLPEFTSLSDVFVRFPERSTAMFSLLQSVMRGTSEFSHGERELIAVHVSKINSCNYCAESHENMALALGLSRQIITEFEAGLETDSVLEKLRPVLRFVEKLTTDPAKMAAKDAEAIYAAGWSEDALFDAISVCALFNLMNRVVDGAGCINESTDTTAPIAIENYEEWGKQLGL